VAAAVVVAAAAAVVAAAAEEEAEAERLSACDITNEEAAGKANWYVRSYMQAGRGQSGMGRGSATYNNMGKK
jgi:hypothetical protein